MSLKNIAELIKKLKLTVLNNGQVSFSQEGEDVLLNSIFWNVNSGFYVDVGAFHPYLYSNTYFFYNKGWQGINIDPNHISIELFNKCRPKDKNIETAVGRKKGTLTYYIFNNGAINTIDKKTSENNIKMGYKLISKRKVKISTLEGILSKYCPDRIDLMSIDVEGMELDVVKGNNWNKYRPKILVVEMFNKPFSKKLNPRDLWQKPEQLIENPVHVYLSKQKYRFIAKTTASTIYIDEKNN
jgi:FkbM family methyltransferase